MKKLSLILTLLATVTACGGGSDDGGGGSVQGPTTHTGMWEIRAVITAVVGATTHDVDTTSMVNIESSGAVSILTTDTDCALSIYVNGNTMTYRESCVFRGEIMEDEGVPAPCTLEMESVAGFTSSNSASGTFGPKTLVCVGSAASYSGTLVAVREGTLPDPAPAI